MKLYLSRRYLSIVLLCMWATTAAGSGHLQTTGGQKSTRETSAGKIAGPESASLSDEEIIEARKLLDQLGYWVDLEEIGVGPSLRHALAAFQKVELRRLTGILTGEELTALRIARKPSATELGYSHIEVDLSRQILFLIQCSDRDLRILPISSGSGELFTEGGVTRRAITPTGRFKIYRKIEGWRKSPLGLLYYPNYINEGVAIHGSPLVPLTPASHGCIRIPMFAAKEFSQTISIGTPVLVYDEKLLELLEEN